MTNFSDSLLQLLNILAKEITSRGLRKNGKIIASWCDNYDLQVNTPNGQRETHSMAIEWRQQVPDNNDFDSIEGEPLVIPRLSRRSQTCSN